MRSLDPGKRHPTELLIALTLAVCSAQSGAQPCFSPPIPITTSADQAFGVAVADIDGDGDLDVVSSSLLDNTVAWYENDGAISPSFVEHIVSEAADNARSVRIVDLDSDGDRDIVVAAPGVQMLLWFENNGKKDPSFVANAINIEPIVAEDIITADIDGDGDSDLIAHSPNFVSIWWFENDGQAEPSFIRRVVTQFTGIFTYIDAVDIDDDGDLDVLSTSDFLDRITWHENQGGKPPSFADRELFSLPGSDPGPAICSADFDGDGDIDVAARFGFPASLSWFENDGEAVPGFLRHQIPAQAFDFEVVQDCDLDGDGDIDLLASSRQDGAILWYENDGENPPDFSERLIALGEIASLPRAVSPADIDADGDLDVIAAFQGSDTIAWLERVEAENLRTRSFFMTLADAIQSALPTDSILADTSLFGVACQPVLDFAGKSVDLVSSGPVVRLGDSRTILADGGMIIAGLENDIQLQGLLNVPDLATATLVGDTALLEGEVTIGNDAQLMIEGDAFLKNVPVFVRSVITGNGFGRSIMGGDIDGDGDVDFISEAFGIRRSIAWHQNDGSQDPQFTSRLITWLSDYDFSDFHIVDFDGDGDTDILAGDRAQRAVVLLKNDGQMIPEFAVQPLAELSGSSRDILAGDMDGDGDMDVVLSTVNQAFSWLDNDGASPPTLTEFVVPASIERLAVFSVEDLDGDGDLDVLGASTETDEAGLAWYENDGSIPPSFLERIIDLDLENVRSVRVADCNGDGAIDIALATIRSLVWYENSRDPNPTFEKREVSFDRVNITSLEMADIDGDSNIDMVVTVDGNVATLRNVVAWLENDGQIEPSFSTREIATGELSALHIDLADIDGDGDTDIFFDSAEDTTLGWYRNQEAIVSMQPQSALHVSGEIRVSNQRIPVEGTSMVSSVVRITLDRTSSLKGSGLASAPSIQSAGTIEPDPGAALTLDGDYTQSFDDGIVGEIAGTLRTDLGDGTAPSRVDGTGTATLAGALAVSAADDFDPADDAAFDVLTASQVIDRFAVAFLPGVLPNEEGDGRFLRVRYPVSEGVGGRGTVSVSLVVDTLTGDITTDPPETFEVDGRISDAALGDLNGDGLIDLAVTVPDEDAPGTAPGSLIVLFNAGVSSGFWQGFSSSVQITVGRRPEGVAVGNIDASGGLDIAVTNRADDTAMLITNDGLGSIGSLNVALTVDTGDEPVGVALADIDNDKFDDLIVTEFGSDSVGVFTNSGFGRSASRGAWSGMGARSAYPVGDQPLRTVVADIDNDKFDDLVAANAGDGTLSRLRNNIGAFEPQIVSIVGAQPIRLIAADLNEDGADDIAVVNRVGDSVSVLLSTPGFNLTSASTLPVGNAPSSLAAVDLDGDGDRDLAVVAEQDGAREVRVLRNDFTDGQLIFAPATTIETGADPLLVLAGDVNNDGRDDLVTVNTDTGGGLRLAARSGAAGGDVSVVLQSGVCDGDANGDRMVDVNDIGYVLKRLGSGGPDGDANGDGVVDVNDISYVLFRLGSGCP